MRTITVGLVTVLVLNGALASAGTQEPEPPPPPRVLVYSGTQSFHHTSIEHGNPIIASLAASTGAFVVDVTNDPAAIVPQVLRDYDAVLFNSPSGESFDAFGVQPAPLCLHDALDGYGCTSAPFSQEQRDAFIAWVECGGGVVGVHQVLDAWHDWPEWDELTGFVFLSHFSAGEARVHVESDDPIAAPYGAKGTSFTLSEEYYAHFPGSGPEDLASDLHPLLGIGEFTDPGTEATQGVFYADHAPLAWTSTFRGSNRTFMTNLGHSEATWDLPAFQQSLVAGIAHVTEVRPDPACMDAIPSVTLAAPNPAVAMATPARR